MDAQKWPKFVVAICIAVSREFLSDVQKIDRNFVP